MRIGQSKLMSAASQSEVNAALPGMKLNPNRVLYKSIIEWPNCDVLCSFWVFRVAAIDPVNQTQLCPTDQAINLCMYAQGVMGSD